MPVSSVEFCTANPLFLHGPTSEALSEQSFQPNPGQTVQKRVVPMQNSTDDTATDRGAYKKKSPYLSDELADERERAWRAKTGEQRRAKEKERKRKEKEKRKREDEETEKLFEPMTIPQLRLVKTPLKLRLGNYLFDDDGYVGDYDSDSQMGSVDDGEKGDEHMREASGMKRKVKRGKDEVSDDDEESHGENDGAARKRNWNSMNSEKMDAGSDDENEEEDIQPPLRKVRKTSREPRTKFSQLENNMF